MMVFWICMVIGAIVIELITPTALVSIWFACGAAIAFLLEMLGADITIQIVAFFAVSLITMVIVRPIATRYLRGNVVATNADRMINEIGLVSKDIREEAWGEVKIKGSIWSAVSKDTTTIEVGKRVKVVAIEGAKLIVKEVLEN